MYLLLRIVGRVGKNSRINPSSDSITAFDDNAVPVGVYELVVKEYVPLRMEHFSATMSQ